MHTTQLGSLRRISEVDFEVAPHEHDVRGWKVVLANDEAIGKVDDLIIDPAAETVRYLDVEIDRKAMRLERDRHVAIPISDAQLDAANKLVVLSRMTRTALMQLPEDIKTFDAAYDTTYRSHLSDKDVSKRMTRSAEELRIGKRVEKQGEVRVSKHVETEHVRQDVPLSREEVRVERRPVKEGATSRAEFGNDEIVVPVMGEEAIIEKRPVEP